MPISHSPGCVSVETDTHALPGGKKPDGKFEAHALMSVQTTGKFNRVVKNNGPYDATDVSIVDVVNSGFDYLPVSITGGGSDDIG